MTRQLPNPLLRRFAALASAGLLGLASPAAANSDVAAALAGGLVGAAIGVSLASHPKHASHKSNPHFSPKPGVTCYDRQAACYHSDGSLDGKMTWEIYR